MKKQTSSGVPRFLGVFLFLVFCIMLPIRAPAQEAASPSRPCKEGEDVEECIKRLRKTPRGISTMQLKEYESTTTLQNPEGREVEEGFVTRRRLPSDEQGASAFEAYVQGLASSGTSTKIRQFGYDLFDESPTTFAPANMLPVGPDYLLGPGDQILITLWGKINLDYERVIDSEGKIVLPEIGVLRLSGQTFAGAKTFLEKELSRYYQASEIKMNISMGSLRSMRIFVVGKALYPGSYTLSSFSTLVNALFASGGPSKLGTMRDIQVKRNGETITHFDLYDFLLKGDKTKDIRLMPEDVIFIPTIGPLVGIAGNVKVPAIYELKGETGLRNIIEMAGGVSATGYLRQVQVVRIIGNETKVVQDLNLERLTESVNIPLQDGDLVKVFPITQTITNPIELKGNLLRPGTYEWKAGIKVRDIIKSSEDLLPDTFLEFALVERRVGPDYHKEYLSFDIGRLFMEGDEKENIPLSPYDTIVVFNKQELVGRDKVRITGAVNKPGENEFRPNMKLSDLLKLAGGFKRYAFTKEAELTRVTPTPEGPKIEKIVVALAKVMDGDPAYDIPLKEDDYLFVRAVPEWELYRTVSITGEVRFPGTYTVQEGETLSSLIKRAGGFTSTAYLKGAIFTRKSVQALQKKQINERIDRLEQQLTLGATSATEASGPQELAGLGNVALQQRKEFLAKLRAVSPIGRISMKIGSTEEFKGSPSDIPLEEDDSLFVPALPASIQVMGSVYNQGAHLYLKTVSVSDYIKKAGGMDQNADADEIYVLKIDGTAVSRHGGASGSFFPWGFMGSKLDPGDTIVVPEKVDQVPWLVGVRDFTQVLYQIAVSAAVILRF